MHLKYLQGLFLNTKYFSNTLVVNGREVKIVRKRTVSVRKRTHFYIFKKIEPNRFIYWYFIVHIAFVFRLTRI